MVSNRRLLLGSRILFSPLGEVSCATCCIESVALRSLGFCRKSSLSLRFEFGRLKMPVPLGYGFVIAHVIPVAHEFEIFQAIITGVEIPVMNNRLLSGERWYPPKQSTTRHNPMYFLIQARCRMP